MKILYVAVNYGTADHARTFQRQFNGATREFRTLLVDNSDGPARGRLEQELPADLPQFRCVTAPGNLGYFGGMRHGLSLAFARDYRADWTVICNVDVLFSPDSIAGSLAALDPASVACVAPSIVSDLTGVDLNPHMRERPSSARMRMYKRLFDTYWGLVIYTKVTEWIRVLRGGASRPAAPSETTPIYAPHGSFMILGRGYFESGGSLEHQPFLFGEEITVAENARRIGKPVVYDPSIRIKHAEHVSTSKLPSRVHHRFVRESVRFLADAYFSDGAAGQPAERR